MMDSTMKRLLLSAGLMSILSLPPCMAMGQNPYEVTAKSNDDEQKTSDDRSDFVKRFTFIPMADWHNGMKFMVAPDEHNTGFDIDLQPYRQEKDDLHPMKVNDFAWKTFIVDTVEERYVKCMSGTCTRTYVVFTCEDMKYEYEYIDGSKAEMRSSQLSTKIDNLVYLEDVDSAKAFLIGKTLFILSKNWIRNVSGYGPRFA